MNRTPVMIMAGGKGSRLGPLTCHRAKPSVPFGGRYRIIDFVLSNFLNSGYRQVFVLTQYMASSLIRHLNHNWQQTGMFIEIAPAQMRTGEYWYRGTADSVYQCLHLVEQSRPEHLAIFGGDHIYKFAIEDMEQAHRDRNADLTVAAFAVPKEEADQFGVIQVDDEWRIQGFQEKPKENPATIPGRPDQCLVSMGNYFFRYPLLREALLEDARDTSSAHDFGKDVIPRLLSSGRAVFAYDFGANRIPGEPQGATPYWRDVGTIDSYFAANMDLRSALPRINLYNRNWRIRTAQRHYPPARFVRHEDGNPSDLSDSLVCEGSIVSSAELRRVLVGYDCFIHAGSRVEDSLFLSGCDVGANSHLRKVLMDKNCSVEPGTEIGLDPERDAERFPFRSASGIVVLPKGTHVPRQGPVEFAHDMDELMRNDPNLRPIMEAYTEKVAVGDFDRWSHSSAGPRYHRFGPGALSKIGTTRMERAAELREAEEAGEA